jgi:hypothetical protein
MQFCHLQILLRIMRRMAYCRDDAGFYDTYEQRGSLEVGTTTYGDYSSASSRLACCRTMCLDSYSVTQPASTHSGLLDGSVTDVFLAEKYVLTFSGISSWKHLLLRLDMDNAMSAYIYPTVCRMHFHLLQLPTLMPLLSFTAQTISQTESILTCKCRISTTPRWT